MIFFRLINILTYQMMIDEVIGELNLEIERNYLNNIIIGSETFEKHLKSQESIYLIKKS
jgi:hypothetical protein